MAEGRDENFDTVQFGTPWSAPLNVEVRSDFRRRLGQLSRLRAKRARFTMRRPRSGLWLLARDNRLEFAPASAFPRC